jgi:uncharacterized NAD-dependent epimerase/dehydratase family protein
MFDGCNHQVMHVFALDAFGGGDKTHGFSVAAIKCKSDPDLLAIVATQLEAVRAPTKIGAVDCDAAIVASFLSAADVTLQQ